MKKVKILLSAALIGAALFSFAACKQESTNTFLAPVIPTDVDDDEADTDAIVDDYISGTANNATVDKTNDGTGNFRTIVPLKTKHWGSRAVITQTDISTTTAHGVMGYAFNVIYHKAGDAKEGGGTYAQNTADFTLVSVTYSGDPIYYISAYRNITDFQGTNFGVASSKVYKAANDADGSQFRACTEACEYEIVALPEWSTSAQTVTSPRTKNLTTCKWDSTAKTLKVAINVTANDNGSYTVDFYNPDDVLKEDGKTWISSAKVKTKTPGITKEIPNYVTGYSAKALSTQALLGVYANIYPSQNLKGTWRLSAIKGETEVEEFED